MGGSEWFFIVLMLVGIIVLVFAFLIAKYFRLWIQCKTTHNGITLIDLIGQQLRRVNPELIVRARIMAVQSNVEAPTRDLESLYLAGGNVPKVLRAMISASRAAAQLALSLPMSPGPYSSCRPRLVASTVSKSHSSRLPTPLDAR